MSNEKRNQKDTSAKNTNTSPLLIILSGLSGAGKDTVLDEMKKRGLPFHFAVTATTRPMRQGEEDGKDYYFVSKEKFEKMIEKGEFLEWAEVYGNLYGVPKSELKRSLDDKRDVVVKVDVQGAATLKKLFPEAIFIFLIAPSQDEIEKRLRERGTDEESSLKIRLEKAQSEMEFLPLFNYKVVNYHNRVEEAISQIEAIVAVEKCRANLHNFSLSENRSCAC